MTLIRRDTDYGMRLIGQLASVYPDGPVSARELASVGQFPYQLGCKVLQRLRRAGLVQSSAGTKGGFRLGRPPSQISLFDIIAASQGAPALNACIAEPGKKCPREDICVFHPKLLQLQEQLEERLRSIKMNVVVPSQVPCAEQGPEARREELETGHIVGPTKGL